MKRAILITPIGLALCIIITWWPAFAQQPTPAERVAALKTQLANSQAMLRQYEWIETTTVSVKGEEKSRKQQRCYVGADGKVTKVLLTNESTQEAGKRGLRGKIAEHKKEELTDSMYEAINLVRLYVPLDQARIQRAKDSGKVSIQMTEPNKRARLVFSDYLQAGDSLAVDVNLANNHPLAANVNSYLDSQEAPVTLSVKFGTLNDGSTYPSQAILDVQGKNLTVTIENSGYRKVGQ
jgi:hypothetical protein